MVPRRKGRKKMKRIYEVSSKCGAGFEIAEGRGFFVSTLVVESARERVRQEIATGRPFVSAAIYENGRIVDTITR